MTDQKLMKTLKQEMKDFQKEMKNLKDNPSEFMKVQKRAMETNMKYMMHSMIPTLITLIPIILIFGWLNAHFAYEPIIPGEEFSTRAIFEAGTTGSVELKDIEGLNIVSDVEQEIKCYNEKGWILSKEICKAEWKLEGDAGNYLLEYEYDKQIFKKELLISEEKEYTKVTEPVKGSKLKALENGNEKVKPIPGIGLG